MYLMCRLCFTDEGSLELMFGIEKSLIKTITNHLFELKEIDGWPNGICEDCKSKLTITTNFFNICKNTQKILLEQLGEKKTPLLENSFDDSEDNSQLTQSSSDDPVKTSDDNNESLLEELIILERSETSLESDNSSHLSSENTYDEKSDDSDRTVNKSDTESEFSSEEEHPFTCSECGRSFAFKGSLSNHLRSHTKLRKKIRKKSSKWAKHSDSDASEDTSDEKSDNSNRIAESKLSSAENLFQCTAGCGKSFSNKTCVTIHMRNNCILSKKLRNIRKRSFKWTRDSDPDASEEESSSKKKRITKNPKNVNKNGYECLECHKILKTKSTLQTHKAVHSESRPFKCEKCNQTFKLYGSLYNHNKIHIKDKKFKCGECERSFMSKRDLTRHLKIHLKKKLLKN